MQEAGAWSFPEKSVRKASTIRPGDGAVVYLTGEGTVGAALQFTGQMSPASNKRLFNAMYPYEVPFTTDAAGRPVHVTVLAPQLEFVKNKKNWQSHFQGQAIRSLGEADFILMRDAFHGKATVAQKVNNGHK